MYLEPRDYRSGRSSLGTKEKRRSRSRVSGSRDTSIQGSASSKDTAAQNLSYEQEGVRERIGSQTVSTHYSQPVAYSDLSSERSTYSDVPILNETDSSRYVTGSDADYYNARGSRDQYGRLMDLDMREQSTIRSYDCDSHASTSTRHDEVQAKPTGASFTIGLGKHSLSGGIHFAKNNKQKRSSFVDSSSLSKSKKTVDDHLAYGSFDENHLAYPDSPRGRTNREFSRRPHAQSSEQISNTSQRYHSPHYQSFTSSSSQINYDPVHRRGSSPSSEVLSHRMSGLGINLGHRRVVSAHLDASNASGSPLLEPYQGTYQTISPMPSPPLSSAQLISPPFLEPLSPNSSNDDRGSRTGRSSSIKPHRKARFHDPEEEASLLAEALKGSHQEPDTAPLISILPGLTHAQVFELRSQYKKLVKTGREKKDVNIAKHIKVRLKSQPVFMKACYTCALGQWESEAYWINVWSRSDKSRKELLIESLMGRTNEEIRAIKKGFRNKAYDDDLVKFMRMELPENKFKKSVMLVLEEKRMEERQDSFIDFDRVNADVKDLRKAIKSEKGGESAIIEIVILRSNAHLKEVLRVYRQTHGSNLAKAILKKSGNLAGELLAHILNGIINMPVRDALLLHHALFLPHSDQLRPELLISRLVRYHWDRPHFELVRVEFRHRYAMELQTAVTMSVSGDLSAFLEALCVRRVEDDVRVL